MGDRYKVEGVKSVRGDLAVYSLGLDVSDEALPLEDEESRRIARVQESMIRKSPLVKQVVSFDLRK